MPRLPLSMLSIAFALAAAQGGRAEAATLDAGVSHNLAVTGSGRVVAWGENSSGALGNGTLVHSSVPVRSGTLTGVTAVSAGGNLSAAVLSNGTVWTWGSGEGLAPGAASTCFNQPCSLTPIQMPGLTDARGVAVSSTGHFVIALSANGTVRAWGTNRYGTLGNGSTAQLSTTPVVVSGLSGITAIAAGRNHAVALRSDGTVWSWGLDERGELGASLLASAANTCDGKPCSRVPVQVLRSRTLALDGVTAISSKGRHTLARRSDATVWAWGSNIYGQLGDGTVDDRGFAFQVITGVASIAAGVSHSIALRQDGAYMAWGLGLSGRHGFTGLFLVESCPARPVGTLGGAPLFTNYMIDDPWSCKRSPTITGRTGITSVVGGGAHTLAVRANGAIDAFGLNSYGQLGTPPTRTFVSTGCYSDPESCPGSPQGATASGVSIGLPSSSGLNAITLDEGLEFAVRPVGTTSPAQELSIRNVSSTSTVQVRILSVAATGDFAQTSSCVGTTLLIDQSCDVNVTFTPTAPGARSGTLTVTTDQATSPTGRLELLGTGTGHEVRVTKSGSGAGTVSSSPAGISCGATCSAYYAPNATVTLTQSASPGSTFGGWSGDCTGSGTCAVTMNAAKNIAATFNAMAPAMHVLTVTRGGSGTGSVTSVPAGINCGSTCSANFNAGATVTLTASAATGSTFSGWSSPCTASGTGPCTVTMNAATSVTANFAPAPTTRVLTVTRGGSGTGSVTSVPAGINCGSTCSASFTAGATVTLTASAVAGSTFSGWSSPCTASGTGPCTVTMNADTSVSATFNGSAAPTSVTAKTLGSRATVAPNATLYGGFEIGSSGQVYILVRGNSLGSLGITQGFLDAPRVQVFNAQQQNLVFDSGGRPGFNGCVDATVVAFYQNVRAAPVHAEDGCVVRSLAAGAYTFTVTPSVAAATGGVASAPASGEVLFEVTLGGGAGSITTTLGSRASVTPQATHYGGFELMSPSTVYILVRGNSLGSLGITQAFLDAPRVQVFNAQQQSLVLDAGGRPGFNGCVDATVVAFYQNVRAAPVHAEDACVVRSLAAGAYTFTVTPSVAANTGGIASSPASGEVLFEVTLRP